VILQQYFTYFFLSGNADLRNFYEFYYPAIKRLKTGFLSTAGNAVSKTGLKKNYVFERSCLNCTSAGGPRTASI